MLKPDSYDLELNIYDDTKIIITKNQCSVSGDFFEYYKKHILPKNVLIVDFLNEIDKNPFKLQNQDIINYGKYIKDLVCEDYLDLYNQDIILKFFCEKSYKLPVEYKTKFQKSLEEINDIWNSINNTFPIFFYRKMDKHLNTRYKFEDISKELKNPNIVPNSLLYDFVKLIGMSTDEFIKAANTGSSAEQETLRKKINRLVDNKINKPFYDFYKTEKIALDLSFNSGNTSFIVQSENGEALML